MGFFNAIVSVLTFPLRIFSRKKDAPPEMPQIPLPPVEDISKLEMTQLSDDNKKADMDRIRAKLDLVLTELDSLKILNQTVNERLRNIESKLIENKDKIRYM